MNTVQQNALVFRTILNSMSALDFLQLSI